MAEQHEKQRECIIACWLLYRRPRRRRRRPHARRPNTAQYVYGAKLMTIVLREADTLLRWGERHLLNRCRSQRHLLRRGYTFVVPKTSDADRVPLIASSRWMSFGLARTSPRQSCTSSAPKLLPHSKGYWPTSTFSKPTIDSNKNSTARAVVHAVTAANMKNNARTTRSTSR